MRLLHEAYGGLSATRRSGFTLVELSIVLVLIALLIGGILGGQEMVHAGKISRTVGDTQKYITAYTSFSSKYGAPPGDFEKATDYWGANSVCPAATGTGSPTATCNGNGDGLVGVLNPFMTEGAETRQAWRQLADAGYISGSYNPANPNPATGNWGVVRAGVSAPAAPLGEGGVFQFMASTVPVTWASFFDLTQTVLILGNSDNGGDFALHNALPANDAASIDRKMDDGLPGTGTVRGPLSSGGCVTSDIAATSLYVATNSVVCTLFFATGS